MEKAPFQSFEERQWLVGMEDLEVRRDEQNLQEIMVAINATLNRINLNSEITSGGCDLVCGKSLREKDSKIGKKKMEIRFFDCLVYYSQIVREIWFEVGSSLHSPCG